MNGPARISPLPFLAGGLLCLLAAIWAGWLRLPLALPRPHPMFAAAHGPLMIAGFLGTVIAAERAAALGGRIVWLPAALAALGGLLLAAGPLLLPAGAVWRGAGGLFVLSAAGLVAVFARVLRLQATIFHGVMAAAALALLAGSLLFALTGSALLATPWWLLFLVGTITGERLELNRLLPPRPRAKVLLLVLLATAAAGALLGLVAWGPGQRLLGAALAGIGLWLLRNDLARRTIRLGGPTRYTAACLLSGHAWLLAGGLLQVAAGPALVGPLRDAALHAVFVGFVLAMIFGHAPIIVPALTGVAVRHHLGFYLPLALLHLGLLLRVAGDLAPWPAGHLAGGPLNGLTILLFIAVLLGSLRGAGPSR
jgi:hypothetical protein